jgi:hypothetical protein
MKKLIIFGQNFDVDSELELKVNDELGLDCHIKFKDDIDAPWAGKVEVRHNCTEFHHLYNFEDRSFDKMSSAFESDIHCTGGTKSVSDIEWIVVVKAIKLNSEY